MTSWTLVWAELGRRPERTLFTLASLAVGFFVFGLLQGVNLAFDTQVAQSHADQLMISGRFGNNMPLTYLDRIEHLRSVKQVTWLGLLPTYYRDPKQSLLVLASPPDRFFSVLSEFKVSPATLNRLIHTRTGVVIFDRVAKQFGWKVGDQVNLISPGSRRDGSPSWTFDIVGIATCPSNPVMPPFALINYTYFDDNRATGQGTVAWFWAHVADPTRAASVGRSIDRLFINSASPTQTQPESAFFAQAVSQIGEARWFTNSVIIAVFFAMIFVTSNVIFESVRERTRELAVLKTVGYSNLRVFMLIELEALALCLSGAFIGLAIAAAAFRFVGRAMGNFSEFLATTNTLSISILLAGVGSAAGLTLIAGAIPMWMAKRLAIVEALRVRT